MKKSLILLPFFALFCAACSISTPQTQTKETDSLTGLMTVFPTHNQDGIPYCKPYQAKPLHTGDIINIDDVVEDCSYQTGHILYSPFGGGSNLPTVLNIRENLVTIYWDTGENRAVCDAYGHLEYSVPARLNNALLFVGKYFSRGAQPFDNMYAEGFERDGSVSISHHCKEKHLCKKLINLPFGENEKHYFYYASRALEHEDGFRDYLKIDDKIYSPGESIRTDVTHSYWIYQQSIRNVNELKNDRLKVSRYINGELIDPYKSNPELIDTDENERKVKNEKSVIIGTFQIQSCNISLNKEAP